MIDFDQKMKRYQPIWYLSSTGAVSAATHVRKLGFVRSALVVIRVDGKDTIVHRSDVFMTAEEAAKANQERSKK